MIDRLLKLFPEALGCLLALLFCCCSADSEADETQEAVVEEVPDEDSDDLMANTTFDRTVSVVFSTDGTATVSNAGSDFEVVVSGNDVTVTNNGSENVIYALSGTTTDGCFKLYSSKKQAIALNGVSITNKDGAAINNQSKKRTFVTVEGTNYLTDGPSYNTPDGEDEKAAFFSEGQLVFSGSGSLTVTASGGAGITSDDYLRFLSAPTVTVRSSAGHGIRGKEAVIIASGTIEVSSSAAMKKGIASDGKVTIMDGTVTASVSGAAAYDSDDAEYKGAAGIKADVTFRMTGGQLTVVSTGNGGKGIKVGSSSTTGTGYFEGGTVNVKVSGSNYGSSNNGGRGRAPRMPQAFGQPGAMDMPPMGMYPPEPPFGPEEDGPAPDRVSAAPGFASNSSDNSVSAKGIKSTGDLFFTDGIVTVTASAHEGIEAKGEMKVSGGQVYAQSSDDAINSASHMTITGGYVCAYSTGNDGLDANGNCYVKGGVVYAVGAGSPEMGIDANTEGGYKLYVSGGTLVAVGGLENGSSLTQSCYSASWSDNTWYALYSGGDLAFVFKTPSSGGSGLVVSTSATPSLKSGVTASGTACFNTMGYIDATVSGGSSVALSSYTGGNGGGGGPRWMPRPPVGPGQQVPGSGDFEKNF